MIETARRRLELLRLPTAATARAQILGSPQVMLLTAGSVLVVNHLVLAAAGHLFAASCVDAVLLVLLLAASAVHEHLTGGRDATGSRAFGAVALVAAVPVAAAALPLRHMSEATGTIAVGLPVFAACIYFAARYEMALRPVFTWGDANLQAAVGVAAIVLGFCAYLLRAPAASMHGGGASLLAVAALVVAAVTEELLFRGIVQESLAQSFGVVGALFATLLSVALFTTVSWWLISLLCASLMFALVVARTAALGPAIVAHAAFTLSATVVWPTLLGTSRPALPIALPVGVVLCGGCLAGVAAVALGKGRRRV